MGVVNLQAKSIARQLIAWASRSSSNSSNNSDNSDSDNVHGTNGGVASKDSSGCTSKLLR